MEAGEDTYRREVIRAEMEYRGVPPRDEWGDLSALERDVAETLVDEQGEDAFTGEVLSAQLEIDAAFGVMLGSIDQAFPQGRLTPERIDAVEQSTREAMANFSLRAENVLTGGRTAGHRQAIEAHQAGLNRAASEVGAEVSDQLLLDLADQIRGRAEGRRTVELSAEALVRRRGSAATDAAASWIKQAEGRPGREAGRELLRSMGEHDRIQNALSNQGARGENVRRAIQRAGRAAEQLGDEAKQYYTNAKRVLVHEQNQAFHEADVLSAQESPAVRSVQWRRSRRHFQLESSPDVCDAVAELDVHGLGEGRYFPGAAPSLLHPFGECTVIPNTVPPDDWGEIEYEGQQVPNREPREVGFDEVGAALRANLTAANGEVTTNKIARSVRTMNRAVSVAFDRFVDL